ncbi:hypothetical protein [Rhizobium sp. RU36D]|uniref:hypothetical protein n=1 Tax=Rhizobium sp. RU36D TaxID=1907415 RepID=UPI0009D853DD|nr:hypothetical protein [Rhizobium sp. RU36D]SMD15647.1 hypothetical protein SAMN05880593_1285 [Rhizobium sp. RU36D]
MRKISFAVAAAVLGLSFAPVYAQAPATPAAVVAACAAGGNCAVIVQAFLATVPVAERAAAIGQVTVSLGNAAVAGTVSRDVAAAGVAAAAEQASGAQQVALNNVVETLNNPAASTEDIATASTNPGASGSGV